MLGADPPGARFQRQFHRHQHRVQSGAQHDGQHLRHHPVAAGLRSSPGAALQRLGMSANGAPLRSAPGLLCSSGM
ncbi:MAG: hypothetical protein LKM32_07240 [Chiayiivirga sp.]|uniref:hypothetical protein n=1 Tax=Chiayiivirga sp. TaxID=2041042 RepID=UPI0025BB6D0D|nr:hypothetical protein [Chiayiivirga sp.]MCI1729169.1 hypothetical protein [Chiayiivirga sp.]